MSTSSPRGLARRPTESPSRTRRHPEERRTEIVRTAIALADDVGLDRVTARDVASALGVTSGLIHHYFATIDDLVVAALKLHAAENREWLERNLDAYPPLVALGTYIVRVLEISRTSARIWLSAWMAGGRRPDLAVELEHQDELDLLALRRLLERGVEAGVFDVADPLASAMRILTAIDGLVVRVSRRAEVHRSAVDQLVWMTVERETGLPPGYFDPSGGSHLDDVGDPQPGS